MKTSIQVPVFNVEKYVIPCLRSILSDMDADCELLVVDDGSTDDTVALIREFAASEPRIRLELNRENLGIAMTRRKMVRMTEAEYIVPFAADDLFLPGRLCRHRQLLESTPGSVAIYGKAMLYDETIGQVRYYTGRPYSNILIFDGNPIGHGGGMIRRDALLQAGNYQLVQHEGNKVPVACDYFMWQRLGQTGKMLFDNNYTYLYRFHQGQITVNKTELYLTAHHYMEEHFKSAHQQLVESILSRNIATDANNRYLVMQAIGLILKHVANGQERLDLLTAALKIDHDDYGCYLLLFECYKQMNQWDHAEAVAHKTAEHFKDDPFAVKLALEMKIQVMKARGESESAISEFKEHLKGCQNLIVRVTDIEPVQQVLSIANRPLCQQPNNNDQLLPKLIILSRADICGVEEHVRPVDGDHWFSNHLKNALVEQGINVVDRLCDAGALLYLHGVTPPEILRQFNGGKMIWLHSHPDHITAEMLSGFDRIFSLSPLYIDKIKAMGLEAEPLIGATSFTPPGENLSPIDRILFVGNRRKTGRPIIRDLLSLGDKWRSRLDVYGPGWSAEELGECYKGFGIDNANLHKCYNAYRVVLNDHHEDMRREGFLNPRLLDVMASGGLVISDHLAGHEVIFGDALLTYETPAELDALLDKVFSDDEFRRKMIRKGRKAVSHYMFADIAEKLRDCLIDLNSKSST